MAAPKDTNVVLGAHFEKFLARQIENGRYASESEALRAGLHLLEEREAKLQALRHDLTEGEQSDVPTISSMEDKNSNLREAQTRL